MERCRHQRLPTQWLNNRKQYFMSCKQIWLTDRSMDSCERKRRAAIICSVINQSLLPNRSEMSLQRAQRLLPQNPGADEPHLTSRRLTEAIRLPRRGWASEVGLLLSF